MLDFFWHPLPPVAAAVDDVGGVGGDLAARSEG